MRHQRGEFGRGEPDAGLGAPGNLLLRRQRFQFAVDPALSHQILDLHCVHRQQAGRVGATGAHQVVLIFVVGEHQLRYLVGH